MLTPSSDGLGFDSACPPGFRTQLHVTTSLSTGGGPVSYAQLSEGVSRWFTPLACGPGSPESSKSESDVASKLFTFTITSIHYLMCRADC